MLAATFSSRAELGLYDDDVAILFGAQTLADRRKGFNELVQALKLVKERTERRLFLISFGRPAMGVNVEGANRNQDVETAIPLADRNAAAKSGAANLVPR